ncbi:hypothetical protein RUM43_007017 [Polyplax serrata]|uniref:Uncharacterized protein n=1 Tax=Polyplax serrata TaxID=468196 RepID=A0AAN8S8H4_POLSC
MRLIHSEKAEEAEEEEEEAAHHLEEKDTEAGKARRQAPGCPPEERHSAVGSKDSSFKTQIEKLTWSLTLLSGNSAKSAEVCSKEMVPEIIIHILVWC